MRVILASNSPRRKEILSMAGIKFEVKSENVEEVADRTMKPSDVVRKLSEIKAEAVYKKELPQAKNMKDSDFMVIGADTVVSLDGKIFEKPKDRSDAIKMIGSISGRTHSVFTGVTCMYYRDGKEGSFSFSSESKVSVYDMTDEEIEGYVDCGESFDKAGAYAVQGKFAVYVKNIEGEYFNIVGFPIAEFYSKAKGLLH